MSLHFQVQKKWPFSPGADRNSPSTEPSAALPQLRKTVSSTWAECLFNDALRHLQWFKRHVSNSSSRTFCWSAGHGHDYDSLESSPACFYLLDFTSSCTVDTCLEWMSWASEACEATNNYIKHKKLARNKHSNRIHSEIECNQSSLFGKQLVARTGPTEPDSEKTADWKMKLALSEVQTSKLCMRVLHSSSLNPNFKRITLTFADHWPLGRTDAHSDELKRWERLRSAFDRSQRLVETARFINFASATGLML